MASHDGPTGPAGYAGSACVQPPPLARPLQRLPRAGRGRGELRRVGGWGLRRGPHEEGLQSSHRGRPTPVTDFRKLLLRSILERPDPAPAGTVRRCRRGLVPRRPLPFLRSENGHAPGRRIRGCVAPNDDGDGPSGGPQAASPTNCLCTFSPSRLIIFAEGGILYPRDRSEGKASSLRQGGGVRPFLSEVAQVHVQTNPVRRCFVCVRASRSSSC